MRKLLTLSAFLGAAVFAVVSPASAQGFNEGGFNIGLGPFASATYVGPGDITFNGSAANVKEFWSCARADNVAHASTSTSLCDLVDSAAPTVVICTLRATASGFVDLVGTYCAGGVTPATKCAAATGGVCNVSNAYGQIGGVGNAINVTAASQPFLVFSGLGGLPVMKCTAANCVLIAGSAFTLAQPFVLSAAYIRTTTGTTGGPIVSAGTSSTLIGSSNGGSANIFECFAGTGTFKAATDAAWHGGIALFNGTTTNIISVDGSNTSSTNCGTGGFSAESVRLFRSAGGLTQLAGSIAEAMIVGSTASTGDFTNLFNNMNGANGYNGAL
jgi:hypothetical protein